MNECVWNVGGIVVTGKSKYWEKFGPTDTFSVTFLPRTAVGSYPVLRGEKSETYRPPPPPMARSWVLLGNENDISDTKTFVIFVNQCFTFRLGEPLSGIKIQKMYEV
jgi:hypothetical protein